MNISIIGAGYVGLVTGACLSAKGHRVTLVDVEQARIDLINSGTPPIHEIGLQDLLSQHVGKNLTATLNLKKAVIETDVTLIAVGTPFDGERIDLRYIRQAAQQIGDALKEKDFYHVVAVKSTVVPGTTDDVVGPLVAAHSGKSLGEGFGLGMNPEFLTEGQAVADFMRPDRIVLGGNDARAQDVLDGLYTDFTHCPHIRTSNKAAEMIKYASNSLLATMISFSNEIGNLCSGIGGVDVVDVMHGVHCSTYLSPFQPDGTRVTAPISAFLQAGCGFGGSCLPKDVKALISHGEQAGIPMPLLDAVIHINREQPARIVSLMKKHFPTLRGIRTSILGLAFKPDTDDLRESPAFPIMDALLAEGAYVTAYDPVAGPPARKALANKPVHVAHGLAEGLDNAEAVVLVTRWDEFRSVPELLRLRRPEPLFIDGRRMLDKSEFARYEGIGV